MAIQAATRNIRDTFFIVFINHLVLVMAGKTVVLRTSGRMALAAISVGIAMVHWETVIEGSPSPGRSCMALRALPIKMVGRFFPAMTGFTVCRTSCTVIESRSRPGFRAVAGRTLPTIVVGRLPAAVACFTIRGTCCAVIEACP